MARHDTTHKVLQAIRSSKILYNLLLKHTTFKEINLNVTQRKYVKSNLPTNRKAKSLSLT